MNTDKKITPQSEINHEVEQFRNFMSKELYQIDFERHPDLFDQTIGIHEGIPNHKVVLMCLKKQMMGYETIGDWRPEIDSDIEASSISSRTDYHEINQALDLDEIGNIKEALSHKDRRLECVRKEHLRKSFEDISIDVLKKRGNKSFLDLVDQYTNSNLSVEEYRKELLALSVVLSLDKQYKLWVINHKMSTKVSIAYSLGVFFDTYKKLEDSVKKDKNK
jgi:hypothetical protein